MRYRDLLERLIDYETIDCSVLTVEEWGRFCAWAMQSRLREERVVVIWVNQLLWQQGLIKEYEDFPKIVQDAHHHLPTDKKTEWQPYRKPKHVSQPRIPRQPKTYWKKPIPKPW